MMNPTSPLRKAMLALCAATVVLPSHPASAGAGNPQCAAKPNRCGAGHALYVQGDFETSIQVLQGDARRTDSHLTSTPPDARGDSGFFYVDGTACVPQGTEAEVESIHGSPVPDAGGWNKRAAF